MSGFFLRALPEDAKQGTRLKDVKAHTAIDWAVPFEDIARYYPVVEDEIGVSGVEGGKLAALGEHPMTKKAEAAAKKLGINIMRTPRAILRSPPRRGSPVVRLPPHVRVLRLPQRRTRLHARHVSAARREDRQAHHPHRDATRRSSSETATHQGEAACGVKDAEGPARKRRMNAGIVVVAASAIESARLLLLSGEGFNPGGNVGKNLWFSLYVDVNGWFKKDKFPEVMTGCPFIHRTLNYGGRLADAQKRRATASIAPATLDLLWQHDNPIHSAERVATETGSFGAAP